MGCDHRGQKGRGRHISLLASLRQRTISIAAGRGKDFSACTHRRRQIVSMTWQRSGIQTSYNAIVGAMKKHLGRKEQLNNMKDNDKNESNQRESATIRKKEQLIRYDQQAKQRCSTTLATCTNPQRGLATPQRGRPACHLLQ